MTCSALGYSSEDFSFVFEGREVGGWLEGGEDLVCDCVPANFSLFNWFARVLM